MEPDDKSGLAGVNHKEVVLLGKVQTIKCAPKCNRLLEARNPSDRDVSTRFGPFKVI